MFCAMDLNRKNINRAISDNLLKDLSTQYLWLKGGILLTSASRNEYKRLQHGSDRKPPCKSGMLA